MKRFRVLSAVAIAAGLSLAIAAPAGADIINLDPDSDDLVESNGSVAKVSGTLECTLDQVGLSFRVTVTVKQANTKLAGSSGNKVCTGGTQTFTITAHRTQGPALLPGSATLEATAQSGTPHVGFSDVTKASEVAVVVY